MINDYLYYSYSILLFVIYDNNCNLIRFFDKDQLVLILLLGSIDVN